jgi:deoxycytidine triphosphate deaminase
MKESNPVRIVATPHAGFHDPGWKSDIEKQILRSGWNLPEGVNILIPGGLNGYSEGKSNTP